MADLNAALRDLVIANRALGREGVLDAYGHVSMRNPENRDRYFLSRSRGPALVSVDDLIEYTLDGQPVQPEERPMYTERPIHGAVYEARPDVMAVCHNHSPSLLPFSVTGGGLRAMIHLAGLIGAEVPLWDIDEEFGDTDLLVRTMDQGRSLARRLGSGRVALMRGHGGVVAAPSLSHVVSISVYLELNARLQLQAQQLGKVKFLSEGEIAQIEKRTLGPSAHDRAWEYYKARAGFEGD